MTCAQGTPEPPETLLLRHLPRAGNRLTAGLSFRPERPSTDGGFWVERSGDGDFSLRIRRIVIGAGELFARDRNGAEPGIVIAHGPADGPRGGQPSVASPREC